MKTAGKYILVLVMLTVLWLPLAQKKVKFYTPVPLQGAFHVVLDTALSYEYFISGEYQKRKEQHYRYSIGFSEDAIRFKNQIDYDLFEVLNVEEVYEGKDGYFFRFHRPDYDSRVDYLGRSTVRSRALRWRELADSLETRGKELIFIIGASKHIYYKEFVPDQFVDSYLDSANNYSDFLYFFDSLGINYMDCNQWFVKEKSSTEFPLFSKTGFNWTAMAGVKVTDSLAGFVNELGNDIMPRLQWDGLEVKDAWHQDCEIGASLNLLIPLDEHKLYYPVGLRAEGPGAKPRIVVVSDCSWFSPLWYGTAPKVFDESSAFFYYDSYMDNFNMERQESPNIVKEVESADYVIFLCNIPNLASAPWGQDRRILDSYTRAD